ncbi:ABC transporter ATP-binding protein [Vreelandella venusta]|uniref:ABC-type dipeptide transporter n=1 Tax=Vreelandella venusta TaxID=44935 RepID=A0AAP9ZFQ9_9GAMM|nr:dipeptide ABC transporter ATP-binding protein [Halomonas venusta]MBR9923716.1 ABC transporter ATP-binding protein [Gammaproteobacteria bacterium]AZM95826.1 ABC transporter ATP-binding protein [Halomonas venusta]MDX1714485.1 dipeptide ABC transporter ATP-binding protein [Halomonas venusta]NPT30897.1 microcin ABC transporter ATP-binding protein [Halomonas venusta]QPI65824.1 ABC transporter ATP-binding protein [Halomonas venusta]
MPNHANTAKPLLRLSEFCVSFDGNVVVDSLSLTVNAGETLAIVGESGSGKSVSALGAINLLPDNASVSGQRWLAETDLNQLAKRDWNGIRGNQVGFIFQEPMTSLNPLHRIGKQIGETLRLHQGLSGQAARTRAKALLEQVKLPRPDELLDAWPHQLSGGQRQRVMIAMAIANNPALLIADEPTTALDVTVQQEILALLKELRDHHGMGVLFISHDLNLVRRHADRICVMYQGKIQETGSVADVFNNPQSDYTKALIAAEPEGRPAEPADTTPLLTTRQLSVSFSRPRTGLFQRQPPAFEALKATDLTIAPGETLGIVGESGSGKTTLASAVMRLVASQGEVILGDTTLSQLSGDTLRRQRHRLQMVFQDPYGALSPRMPVFDIVSEGLQFHHPNLTHAEVTERVHRTLQEVGLPESCAARYPHEFSGGQRQRIAVARAIILEPELLVLDEPTSALDRTVQKQLVTLLRELQARRQLSYLFISHDLAVVRAMAHRIMVLKDGDVVEQGDCLEVLAAPQHPYTKALIEAAHLH